MAFVDVPAGAISRKDAEIDDLRKKIEDSDFRLSVCEEQLRMADKECQTAMKKEVDLSEQIEALKKSVSDMERINTMLTVRAAE